MHISEMFSTNDEAEQLGMLRTEKDDNSVPKLADLRKTKLTLAQINRLRIMSDVRKLEHEQHIEKVQAQYKPKAEEGAPDF